MAAIGFLGYRNRTILATLNLRNAYHQVPAQSHLWFGRCRLKNFKIAAMEPILDIGTERF